MAPRERTTASAQRRSAAGTLPGEASRRFGGSTGSAAAASGLEHSFARLGVPNGFDTPRPVQRLSKRFKPKVDDPGVSKLETMAAHLDSLTMKAHTLTLQALKAKKPAMVKDKVGSGYYTNWMKNPNPMTTGYIIEDIVTNELSGTEGYESQVVYGAARPDFEITDSDQKRGVVDITSSREAGHVLDKRFSLSSFSYVGESLYPSIDHDNVSSSGFEFTNQDLLLIRESNKLRAKAKLGERLSQLKKQLRLIEDQWAFERPASAKATKAIRAINDIKDFTDEDAIHKANSLIEDVQIALSYKLMIEDVSVILDDLMARYDVDESVFV